MTKKDYIKIAKVFNNHAQPRELYKVEAAKLREVVDDMADTLHKDNPTFNYKYFIEACGF